MASPACREQVMRAPESLVKEVLLALCKDKNVEKTALARLDALTKLSGAVQGPGGKRKAIDDLAVCAQCDKPFYKDDNKPKDCLYHPGDSEVDEQHHVWDDHDENCHGEIDSDYMRKAHPEGFIWSCCDKNGKESAGCTRGYHESDPAKAWKEASETDADEEDSEEDSEEDYDDYTPRLRSVVYSPSNPSGLGAASPKRIDHEFQALNFLEEVFWAGNCAFCRK